MSTGLAWGIGAAYVGAVVGAHLVQVWRQRRAAGGFRVLRWWDWDFLLEGVLPVAQPDEPLCPPVPIALPDQAPPPELFKTVPIYARAQRDAVVVLVQWPNAAGVVHALNSAGFPIEQHHWLELLRLARVAPEKALTAISLVIDRKRRSLQARAMTVGQRVYRTRPRVFVRRLARHWRRWRAVAELGS